MNISFSLESELLLRFSGLGVAGFTVSNLQGAVPHLALSSKALDNATAFLRERFPQPERLSEDPLVACWRDASKACGLKASQYRSSPEQLARRLLSGRSFSTGLPMVDTYCAVSARHLIPFGCYDLAHLPAKGIRLRSVRPESDHFVPLRGDACEFPLTPHIGVYAADSEILCWNFNHRDSQITSLRETTTHAVVFGEVIRSEHHPLLLEAMNEFAVILRKNGAEPSALKFADQKNFHFSLEIASTSCLLCQSNDC